MSGPIRVLLTDDEEIYVESLARVLRNRGFQVRTAGDGPSALEALATEEFDVVVLDLRMPGMDGLATLAEIRRRDDLTPVLLLTGHMDLERVSMALKEGAAEVLIKPCPVDTLLSAIENAHERKVIAREVTEG